MISCAIVSNWGSESFNLVLMAKHMSDLIITMIVIFSFRIALMLMVTIRSLLEDTIGVGITKLQ